MRLLHAQHLRRSADFEAIRSDSVGNVCGAFRLRLGMTDTGMRRLGVIASKRVGNSVARSRAKRLLRESFRNLQHLLPESCDVLLIAAHGILEMSCAEVQELFVKQSGHCVRRLTPQRNHPTPPENVAGA